MDKTDIIPLIIFILMLYLFSIGVVIITTINATETEFCQKNGYETYEYKDRQDFCLNKLFEENELVFERKPIYCERDGFRPLYYQNITKTCYLLKEVVK